MFNAKLDQSLFLLCLLSLFVSTAQASVTMSTVVEDLEVPWDIVFSSEGDLYFTERPGHVKVFSNGELTEIANPDTFTNLRVEGEGGLMGLALAGDFSESQHVYLCYSTVNSDGAPRNRVSRFTLTDSVLRDEVFVINDIPGSPGHNGCRLEFGPDDKLYVTTGDVFRQDEAQDTSLLNGKILRVNPDGSVPADNPFGNEVWSYGHRNPQGLAFAPTGELYSTEHGPDTDDEINIIEAGANYGWPLTRGQGSALGSVPALASYTPNSTIAIAGLDVYDGDLFPWQGDLLFVSLKTGQLIRLDLEDGDIVGEEILLDRDDSGLGRLRDVTVGPDGAIYISTSNVNDRNNFPHEDDDRILKLSPAN